MTYIKIDHIFHEINTLSKMISVPRLSIEKIVDRGMEGESEDYMSSKTRLTLRKMRFASYLVSLKIDEELSQRVLKAFGEDQLSSQLAELIHEEVIDQTTAGRIERWNVSN